MTECNDINCPVHGTISTRGNVFTGIVVSDKMKGTVIVERRRLQKVKKYERQQRAKSRIPAHVPQCMKVKAGDKVEITETKKISKTKAFVVTKIFE